MFTTIDIYDTRCRCYSINYYDCDYYYLLLLLLDVYSNPECPDSTHQEEKLFHSNNGVIRRVNATSAAAYIIPLFVLFFTTPSADYIRIYVYTYIRPTPYTIMFTIIILPPPLLQLFVLFLLPPSLLLLHYDFLLRTAVNLPTDPVSMNGAQCETYKYTYVPNKSFTRARQMQIIIQIRHST